LIHAADAWVVFDTVQYIRHGWINRNRILHPKAGWLYIVVPVSTSRNTAICNVQIANDGKWKKRIWGQIQHYKKHAPYWSKVSAMLEETLEINTSLISELNVFTLKQVCAYLGLIFQYSLFSKMDLKIDQVDGPGDWALRICQALNAVEYINPPGGAALFDESRFRTCGIKLTIQQFSNMTYSCGPYQFEPGLSILDVMMWNSPEEIKLYLDVWRTNSPITDIGK
jgi:hypothetical protein